MTPSTAQAPEGALSPRLDRVRDWMRAPVTTVLGEASLVECAHVFHHAGIRHLAVIDGAGSFLGIVDDGEVFAEGGFTGPPPVWVSFSLGSMRTALDLVIPAEVQTTPDESLRALLGRWFHSGQDAAVALERGRAVGILTEHDVLHMARAFLDTEQRHRGARPVVTVAPWENILRAWEVMGQAGVRHLVIARDNKPLASSPCATSSLRALPGSEPSSRLRIRRSSPHSRTSRSWRLRTGWRSGTSGRCRSSATKAGSWGSSRAATCSTPSTQRLPDLLASGRRETGGTLVVDLTVSTDLDEASSHRPCPETWHVDDELEN